jgi:hypothetical protein
VQKVLELFQEVDFPRGVLPLKEIEECGFFKEIQFIKVNRKKKYEYLYKTTRNVLFDVSKISQYIKNGKMKKTLEVKVKDFNISCFFETMGKRFFT